MVCAAACAPTRRWDTTGLRLVTGLGLGACLADDMGLGKTVQVLALLLTLKAEGRYNGKSSLLVLPVSLLGNWKAELERFAPTLETLTVHPSEQDRQEPDRHGANAAPGPERDRRRADNLWGAAAPEVAAGVGTGAWW